MVSSHKIARREAENFEYFVFRKFTHFRFFFMILFPMFFLHTTKNFFHEGLRLLIRFQRFGIDSPRVRHENLERLGQKIDQKASLGRFLEHFEIGRPKFLRSKNLENVHRKFSLKIV